MDLAIDQYGEFEYFRVVDADHVGLGELSRLGVVDWECHRFDDVKRVNHDKFRCDGFGDRSRECQFGPACCNGGEWVSAVLSSPDGD